MMSKMRIVKCVLIFYYFDDQETGNDDHNENMDEDGQDDKLP